MKAGSSIINASPKNLTSIQVRVLDLIKEGAPTSEITKKLGFSRQRLFVIRDTLKNKGYLKEDCDE